jgi:hypothetical protein
MRGPPPDVIYEEVLSPTPGHRAGLQFRAGVYALFVAAAWYMLTQTTAGFSSLSPSEVLGQIGAWSLVTLFGCYGAAGAVFCVSAMRPLRVWLTHDAIELGGVIGWGPRRIPYADIVSCKRVRAFGEYRLPKFAVLVDKVYGLPFGRDWAFGPHFGWSWLCGGWFGDWFTLWAGVLFHLSNGQTVFIQMDSPKGFLEAMERIRATADGGACS